MTATLDSLPTPSLLLDQARLMRNAERMRSRMAGLGVTLRPHLKTAKSVEAAKFILGAPPGPATVSTLKEAEIFGAAGITDLLYAVCISPQKLPPVDRLRQSGVDLKIILDSVEAGEAVAAHGRQTGRPLPVLIEIDVDDHRSGVPWGDKATLLRIAEALADGAELRGIMCHAGESYDLDDPQSLAAASAAERARMVEAAQNLRAAGFACPVVSVGSTPTALSASDYNGVTEVRAGVYMFSDLTQAGIGVCGMEDIALSVLATVIGHQRDKNWIITDAGWMALSADRSTQSQAVDQYYGLVCDPAGKPYDGIVVLRANQEHGIIAVRPGSNVKLPELRVGDRVRVLPNHACATAAQHDCYHLLDENHQVAAIWPRFRGW